jgi:regulatory protein
MSTARVAALRLLTRRDYTVSEVRTRLAAREFAEDAIDEAIADLRREGLLDDRRAAAAHLRSASGLKGRGRLRIARELESRGVDRGVIQEVLGTLPPDVETTGIERFLDRRRVPARLSAPERRRVFQQLLRRGFPADLIAAVLRSRGAVSDD